MVTECSMSDNIQIENPDVEFVKPCNLCPFYEKNNIEKILDCLEKESNEIKIGDNIAAKSKKISNKNG